MSPGIFSVHIFLQSFYFLYIFQKLINSLLHKIFFPPLILRFLYYPEDIFTCIFFPNFYLLCTALSIPVDVTLMGIKVQFSLPIPRDSALILSAVFPSFAMNFERSFVNGRHTVLAVRRFPTYYISKSPGISAVVGQGAICESPTA